MFDKIKGVLSLDNLKENLTGYIEARLDLLKLEAKHELSKALANLLQAILLGIAGLMTLFFLSLAIGAALNAAFESQFWGYVVVLVLYLIILSGLYWQKDNKKYRAWLHKMSAAIFNDNENNNSEPS